LPDQPQKIGKYEILEQIGVGGFGAVYRGRDPFIKRTVAVKTCQLNDDEIKSRFFREAELAGNLHHRNITTIYDFGVENGVPYIVQEFLTGEDLDKIIKRSDEMPVARKIEILMAISDGLGYAHQHSIIHRDIKPSNIRVLADGSVKIMDFGIAKSLETESSLTQTGITLGTSAYLAPEQIRGEPLDQRTDMFALGILAYELISYRKPFRGEHLSTVLYKILNENPEPLETANPEVPAALSATVARAMEKSIDHRYPDMQAFRQDLQAVYRELSGISSRFATEPRFSQPNDRPTRTEINPDATIVTPSEGMPLAHSITPPSGALARVPDPADHTPIVVSLRPAGLEVVNFRDPSQRATDRPVDLHPPVHRRGHGVLWIAVIVAALVSGGVVFFLSRPASTTPVPSPRPTPAPTAPIAFPQPVVGTEPGRAKAAPTAAPKIEPTAAAVEQKVEPSPRPAPPKRFKVQFSSIPAATLFVDGRRYGPSIPAKTIELLEGTHKVRFEAADLPAYEREFRVGSAGTPPIAYRFPIGHLVIRAPGWVGATVLVDSKFKGVLTGEKTFTLPSGSHRVTLSREGVAPLTQNVTVPEGDNYTWTPPPPAPVS
jgi:serine/threonine-protein kinase